MSARMPGKRAIWWTVGGALLAALCFWLWFALMEQVWEPQRRYLRELADNPMLSATRLLERHRHPVQIHRLLGDVDLAHIPDGTLILADNGGLMSDIQARQLLNWVSRGNTLLAIPKEMPEPGADANAAASPAAANAPEHTAPASAPGRPPVKKRLPPLDSADPLGAHAGLALGYRRKLHDGCGGLIAPPPPQSRDALIQAAADAQNSAPPAQPPDGDDNTAEGDDDDSADNNDGDQGNDSGSDGEPSANPSDDSASARARRSFDPYHFACVTVPGGAYPLMLETRHDVLVAAAGARAPVWSDDDGWSVRVYREDKGRLVMLSTNYFNNMHLPRYDHAELLLALAALNGQARQVIIVHDIGAPPWYKALWRVAHLPLTALALLLLLLLWRAMRRFGPLLPEPVATRRALMEHIEASGNWLWRAPQGRDTLLQAARLETLALLRRRAPDLHALDGDALCRRLARLYTLDENALRAALHGPAAPLASAFAQQIRLLQQVRSHLLGAPATTEPSREKPL